jgi:hypothetical protein
MNDMQSSITCAFNIAVFPIACRGNADRTTEMRVSGTGCRVWKLRGHGA